MKIWVGVDNGGYSHNQAAQLHEPTEEERQGKTWWHLEVQGAKDRDELLIHLAHIAIGASKGDMEEVKDELVKAGVLHRGDGCEDQEEDPDERAQRTRCRGCGMLPHRSMPSGTVLPGFQCLTRTDGEPCKEADALPMHALAWCQRNKGCYEENELLALAEKVPCSECGELPDTLVGDKLICDPCTDDVNGAYQWCARTPAEWIKKHEGKSPSKPEFTLEEKVRRDLRHVMECHNLNKPQQALPAMVDAVENVLKIVEEQESRLQKVMTWVGKASRRFTEATRIARRLLPDSNVERTLIVLLTGRDEL